MKIVIPGEKIKIIKKDLFKDYNLVNCYFKEKNDKVEVYSKFYGVLNENKKEKIIEIIPINGKYLPNIGDFVIAKVKEVMPNMWILDINSSFSATLLLKDAFNERIDIEKVDLSKFYDIGDLVFGKIINITRNKTVRISLKSSSQKKLKNGVVIEVNNILNNWMLLNKDKIINVFKEKNIDILIGKNRLIWLKGNKNKIGKIIKITKELERTLNFDLNVFESI